MTKDYFNILGIDQGASAEEIKKAYKKLAMKHHPDRGGDQSKFQDLQEAYDVLTDNEKRMRWEQEKNFSNQGPFNFSFGFGPNIDDIIRQFHGRGPGPFRQSPTKNRDIRLRIDLDLESTLEKQTHHINVNHTNGIAKTVEIEIPRGIQTGMQIKYTGHGDAAIPNIPPGDLFLQFNIVPHPVFRADGINLFRQFPVNCLDAMLGGRVETTGLDGSKFEINVPPATQNGTKFRITGHGLWDINQSTRGDLILEVSLTVPSMPTTEQLSLLEKFRK